MNVAACFCVCLLPQGPRPTEWIWSSLNWDNARFPMRVADTMSAEIRDSVIPRLILQPRTASTDSNPVQRADLLNIRTERYQCEKLPLNWKRSYPPCGPVTEM